MGVLATFFLLAQIFTVFSSIKISLDMRDINKRDDDRVVFYRDGSGLSAFLLPYFCGWALELFMVALGIGLYVILIVGPLMILLYVVWRRSILIYDKEKIVFPYYGKKNRVIFYEDIEYLQKKRRKHRGGYDGKHFYTYYYGWHWSMCVNGCLYSLGEVRDEFANEKCEIFRKVIQEQYQIVTGNELRIEQIVGHYDEE